MSQGPRSPRSDCHTNDWWLPVMNKTPRYRVRRTLRLRSGMGREVSSGRRIFCEAIWLLVLACSGMLQRLCDIRDNGFGSWQQRLGLVTLTSAGGADCGIVGECVC